MAEETSSSFILVLALNFFPLIISYVVKYYYIYVIIINLCPHYQKATYLKIDNFFSSKRLTGGWIFAASSLVSVLRSHRSQGYG